MISDFFSAVQMLGSLFVSESAPSISRRTAPRSRPPGRERHGSATGARLPAETDLTTLRGQQVTAVLDFENIAFSLRNLHDVQLSPDAMLRRLRDAAREVRALAVLTTQPTRDTYRYSLEAAGFRVLALPHEIVQTCRGPELRANSDPALLFESGVLAATLRPGGILVLLTGDGELGCSVAAGFRRHLGHKVRIVCLSVPGATSRQLATRPGLFDASPIALGRDFTAPTRDSRPSHPRRARSRS